ncbi:uncharacterized protein DEA37_0001226 [Paragonimus westermani]|uniref:IPT/TIG domain-containing protein n=1 Tax=Paragonimus westermani TaxID=34504 RepID=A0A5J4NB24_9TREM|nr:uncharacterized protein DEA37_0001226 [Paragonimus westermani]
MHRFIYFKPLFVYRIVSVDCGVYGVFGLAGHALPGIPISFTSILVPQKFCHRIRCFLALPHAECSLKRSKKPGSVANALNYSGSVLSLSSSQSELKGEKKKHHLFKKKHGKDSLKAAAILSQSPTLGLKPAIDSQQFLQASNSVFDPTGRASQQYGYDPNHDDHDGSVLGAYSDLNGSELYAMGGTNRPSSSGLETVGTLSHTPGISVPNPNSPPQILSPLTPKRNSTMGGENLQADAVSGPTEDVTTRDSDVLKPALLRIEPTSCSTEGGVEVVVHGVGLTEEVMRYASVLVDGITVQRHDWFIEESPSGQPGHYELRIQMPERPTGRCYIELETMSHGRLRCPQEFVYVQAAAAPSSGVSKTGSSTDIRSKVSPKPENPKTSEMNRPDSLSRTGSQRSSLSVVDRRSTRRDRRVLGAPSNEELGENTSELRETNNGSRSKAELHRVDLVDHGASSVNPINITSALDRRESVTSGLVHRGLQRGSLVMVDRRSTRRRKLDPLTETESEIPLVGKEHNGTPDSLHTASNSEGSESTRNSTVSPQTSFRRTGSQRAPIVMLDRRSTRRGRTQLNDGANCNAKEGIDEGPEKDKIVPNEFQPAQPHQSSMPVCGVSEKSNVKPLIGASPIISISDACNPSEPPKFADGAECEVVQEHSTRPSLQDCTVDDINRIVPPSELSDVAPSWKANKSIPIDPTPKLSTVDIEPLQSKLMPAESSFGPVGIPKVNASMPSSEMNATSKVTSEPESSTDLPVRTSQPSLSSVNYPTVQPKLSNSPMVVRSSSTKSSSHVSSNSVSDTDALHASVNERSDLSSSFNDEVSTEDGIEEILKSANYGGPGELVPESSDVQKQCLRPDYDSYGKEQRSPTEKSGLSQRLSNVDSGLSSIPESIDPFTRVSPQPPGANMLDPRTDWLSEHPPEDISSTAALAGKPHHSGDQPRAASRSIDPGKKPEVTDSSETSEPDEPLKSSGSVLRDSRRSDASGQSTNGFNDSLKLENEGFLASGIIDLGIGDWTVAISTNVVLIRWVVSSVITCTRLIEAVVPTHGLRTMVKESNVVIDSLKKHIIELEQQLSFQSAEVQRVSNDLCTLRNRLLRDGATKYLEKKTSRSVM